MVSRVLVGGVGACVINQQLDIEYYHEEGDFIHVHIMKTWRAAQLMQRLIFLSGKCWADDRISDFLTLLTWKPSIKNKAFFIMAFGGPNEYTGKDMQKHTNI
ncbi:MAG: hypothetical protein R3E73_09610 [Porticoccaceae bacterium]